MITCGHELRRETHLTIDGRVDTCETCRKLLINGAVTTRSNFVARDYSDLHITPLPHSQLYTLAGLTSEAI